LSKVPDFSVSSRDIFHFTFASPHQRHIHILGKKVENKQSFFFNSASLLGGIQFSSVVKQRFPSPHHPEPARKLIS
jgi:hypothetical protein